MNAIHIFVYYMRKPLDQIEFLMNLRTKLLFPKCLFNYFIFCKSPLSTECEQKHRFQKLESFTHIYLIEIRQQRTF